MDSGGAKRKVRVWLSRCVQEKLQQILANSISTVLPKKRASGVRGSGLVMLMSYALKGTPALHSRRVKLCKR